MTRFKYILLINLLASISILDAKVFEIVTTEYPPFQEEIGNTVGGMTTEIIREVLKLSGDTGTITIYPWARAYQMALEKPQVLIYSLARNNERERLFKWIGPLIPYKLCFWKLKSRTDIKIKTVADAKHYMVGGVFDDIKAAHLQKWGFVVGKNIEMVGDDETNIKKIYAKHLDLILFDEFSFPYKVKKAGLDINKFTKLIELNGNPENLFFAAHLSTPDQDVQRLREALNSFRQTKRYAQIKKKYIGN
jgi:polar amino acid transport system substrate-binding protein